MELEHAEYVDSDTKVNNLFDNDLDSYFSINRESTDMMFELEDEQSVGSVSIGFFMKSAEEERIQTFSIAIKSDEDDDWTVVIDEKTSDGTMDLQTFSFYPQLTRYLRFSSGGNSFNNWTPLTEMQICVEEVSSSTVESNALFGLGGVDAVTKNIKQLASDGDALCPEPTKLSADTVKHHGGEGATHLVVDGDYGTRWTTQETYHQNDLNNDMIQFSLGGERYLSYVKVAFYDGSLAEPHFSLYTERSVSQGWTEIYYDKKAEKVEVLQEFNTTVRRAAEVFLVGRGNDSGNYTKISEVELWGC